MMKPNKIKVLQVTGVMDRAGTETMLMNIYRHINREQVIFDFLSFAEEQGDYDTEIHKLGGRVLHVKKTNSFMELYRVVKKNGPYDVVHAHTLFHSGLIVFICKFLGIKVRISHAHTTMDDERTWTRRIYQKGMRLLILLFSTHLLACSSKSGSYLFGEKQKLKKKYMFFPNLIDVDAFIACPSEQVTSFKQAAGIEIGPVIGHIGRFIDAKNHRFILQVMKRFFMKKPQATLLLVGDGDNRAEVEQLVKEYGIVDNVRFVGVRDDIPTMLHSMDVFIFPSHYEGLGLVLLEAQACSVPCVVSDVIPDEADMGIQLIDRLSLDENPETWATRLQHTIIQQEKKGQVIRDAFHEKGYSLQKGTEKLLDIYGDHQNEKTDSKKEKHLEVIGNKRKW